MRITITPRLGAIMRLIWACLFIACLAAPAAAAPPPPDVAKTVTFIFLADPAGNIRVDPQTHAPVANGTGFFAIVENENGPGFYGYLVTAKHVLQNERGEYYGRVFLRLNEKNKESTLIPLDLFPSGERKNLFVHPDSSVDVAVIPAWPDANRFEVVGIPLALIRTKEELKKAPILPGSDVFFAGLFTPYYGEKANVPIFRFGRVAMFPTGCVPWRERGKPQLCVEVYLLETMSFGGNSGSPVFFHLGIDREPGKIYSGAELILAGVMRGNFLEPSAGEFIQTPDAIRPVIGQNIGIAAVTPAYFVREVLLSDELKRFRLEHPIRDGSGSATP